MVARIRGVDHAPARTTLSVRRWVSREDASWGSMLDTMDPVQSGLEDALSAFVVLE
jgi:hypothetical protein